MLTGGEDQVKSRKYLADTHNGAALNLNLSAIGVFQLFAKVIGRKVAAILSLRKLLQSLPYKFWQPFKVLCPAQPHCHLDIDIDNFGALGCRISVSTSRLLDQQIECTQPADVCHLSAVMSVVKFDFSTFASQFYLTTYTFCVF